MPSSSPPRRDRNRQTRSEPSPVGAGDAGLALPDNADLVSRIHFSTQDGRIWLDDQRMLLLHASGFGVLRRELIESLGSDRARGLLTRIGYNSGANDAQLARKLRSKSGAVDMIHVGPQLHMLEGVGTVVPVRTDVDEESGQFHGEYLWYGSSEAEEHIRIYGLGAEPACWMQIGYASGFISRFMGRPILFREVQCKAQGYDCCRIVGKPADQWTDAEGDLRFLRADPLTDGMATRAAAATLTPEPASESPASLLGIEDVVGVSAGFNAVCHKIRRVADTRASVLFLGESGVGKEVLARALHRISPRAEQPFVAINCAAIPETLVEAELFGVERGAYTGAASSRAGRFERADGGTLFLDEIGILSNTAQGKLLRALQEREIERVGGTRTLQVDVRVIAATNLDLQEAVRAGRFREDLFYRLNVFPVRVPALRDRLEDIPVFMNHFLRKYCRLHARKVSGFTGRAIDAMLGYRWPGNIRELENVVERGVILAPERGAIDIVHLFSGGEDLEFNHLALNRGGTLGKPAPARGNRGGLEYGEPDRISRVRSKITHLLAGVADDAEPTSLQDIEDALVDSAVRTANGNLAAAARLLGMTRAQLVYRHKSRRPSQE
ncbi:sigma 54-interacting transcriptional regulator [Panacagrimonas sp.]|uniref:sigma 54-interacting transcriptional regulator n=1 Tax=Panacagrimonas sp. TaxID=2480088 RepID=UPI003B526CF5